jgi:curli biogenesis system outer membrane secretion channel CsgG
MKRAYYLSLILLFISVLTGCLTATASSDKTESREKSEDYKGLRYSITVSKFENKSNWRGQWDLGTAWSTVLTDSLAQTNRFIVLGEKDMRKEAMEEQDFAASGRTAGEGKKVATGQMTPSQLLVKGVITHFADETSDLGGGIGFGGIKLGGTTSTSEINVVLYIVDSSTGQVMASKKCYGKVSKNGLSIGVDKNGWSGDLGGFKKTNAGKAIEQAVDEGVKFMMEKLSSIPWTGTVVMVNGGKVYINRGEREGVTAGQKFKVGEATTLRDPDTGEVLDETVDTVAEIEAIQVKEKLTICKILSGSGIDKGMGVRPAN